MNIHYWKMTSLGLTQVLFLWVTLIFTTVNSHNYSTISFFLSLSLRYDFWGLSTTQRRTCTLVEFAGLCNVPFAKSGPLSDRWPDSIDVITGQNCIQEDASVSDRSQIWAVHSQRSSNQGLIWKINDTTRKNLFRLHMREVFVFKHFRVLCEIWVSRCSTPWYFIDTRFEAQSCTVPMAMPPWMTGMYKQSALNGGLSDSASRLSGARSWMPEKKATPAQIVQQSLNCQAFI